MASRLNPYLSFPGDARQAIELYQGVFGAGVDQFGVRRMVNIGQPQA
jgi:hypothetical protein